ncbi:hypothetical protein, partial [Bradyrhizobium sp.]|uniref:hypothetical protein n=1 Tax=Bradyrhizobium sp. TaxID=376 RepID=UPI003C32DD21
IVSSIKGKYFLGVHAESMRSGIIEAAVNDGHYLVRFDTLVGFTDGSRWPEALAIVAVTDMVGSGVDDRPPPWLFFDNLDQRATYENWLNEPPTDTKPRVVPLRRGPPKE